METDPSRWLEMPFYDKYTGRSYLVGVGRDTPGNRVQVKSYRDIIDEYRVHPEPKSLDHTGRPCSRSSIGLLVRRPVQVASLTYIGKESNALEQVELGLIHSLDEVRLSYPEPGASWWEIVVLPELRKVPLKTLVAATGLGERQVRYILAGKRRPGPEAAEMLLEQLPDPPDGSRHGPVPT